jgi:tetratricopeptide (TPR) repeat protein
MSNDRKAWTQGELKAAMAQGASYAGQLADLSHEDLVAAIEHHGGRYIRYSNHGRFGVVVVGGAGLPVTVGGDALPPHHRLISERQFMSLLEIQPEDEADRLYSARALSELLSVPEARINAWVKAGLIQPRRLQNDVPRFEFRQVAVARTLCDLTDAGMSIAELREKLGQLQHRMPDLREPLQQLTMLERNGPLLIRLQSGELSEVCGQLRLEFDNQPQNEPIQLRLDPSPSTALDWHEKGIEHEKAGLLEEAANSYRQALLVGGPSSQVAFDLASVLAALGQPLSAIERYRQATEIDPRHVDAWNNLGILLCESGDRPAACEAFHHALKLDPDDPKLHYNLADVLDDLGDSDAAADHWRAYLKLDPSSSPWAEYARRRLRSA